MIKKIINTVLIFSLALCILLISSCSSQPPVTVDQNITPHDAALTALSTLGYTESGLYESSDSGVEGQKVLEYYSEGSEGYVLDDFLFETLLSPLKLSMFEQYSVIIFNKDLPVPFELVILKLPKTDGKTDSELITEIKKSINTHLDQYKRSMEDYLPQFIPYIENTEIKVTDNFIYYCMAENSSKVTTDIYNFLAGK